MIGVNSTLSEFRIPALSFNLTEKCLQQLALAIKSNLKLKTLELG